MNSFLQHRLTIAGFALVGGIFLQMLYPLQTLIRIPGIPAPMCDSDPNDLDELHAGMKNLINPLIDCKPEFFEESPKSYPIESSVEKYINKAQEEARVDEVGVYYRDLINGPQFGIHQNTFFAGASLFKLPILIAYMRASEKIPGLLDQSVAYEPEKLYDGRTEQTIDPPNPMVPGKKYTLKELLMRMIVSSDNNATKMLTMLNVPANGEETLKEMGVKTSTSGTDLYLTVSSYASIFRILYNATFLTQANSNASLDLLTKVEFSEGLRRPIPANIVVAHKFGERTVDNTSQFHDCGIVYHPTKPYLICIMTRGKNMRNLIDVVADISKIIFDRVNDPSLNEEHR